MIGDNLLFLENFDDPIEEACKLYFCGHADSSPLIII